MEKILVPYGYVVGMFHCIIKKKKKGFEMNQFKSVYMFYDSILSPVQHVCSYKIHSHYIAISVHIPNILKKFSSFFSPPAELYH
jgi:hypothetical protein